MKASLCIFFQSFIFQIFFCNNRKAFWNLQSNGCDLRYSNYVSSEGENSTWLSADLLVEMIYQDFARSGKNFFCYPKRPDRLCRPPSLLLIGYAWFLPRCKADFAWSSWLNSSADVKCEETYECTSAVLTCLHCVQRNSFTFTFPCSKVYSTFATS